MLYDTKDIVGAKQLGPNTRVAKISARLLKAR